MITYENYRGTRHRTLVLLYISLLTLSLAPAMVAPSQRTLPQGQPEMQLAMDNMVTREKVIQKRASSSSRDGTVYQDINFKTSNLLAEAEKVIKTLPDSKERQWIQSFVGRMRGIENMLEKTAQQKNLKKDFESVKGTPVPDGLPKQPTRPVTSAVPEINPFQKPISMMSKIQMTSPEISKVLQSNDNHSERQAVTKPVALPNKVEQTESDELVRELESLHEEKSHQALSENSKVVNQAPTVTTLPTVLASESNHATPVNGVTEKAKLKAKLIEEIEEFHRLGGIMPKEVIDILYADTEKLTDPAQSQNINVAEEMKFTESGMKDRQGILRLDDLHNEDREISMANMKMPAPYYVGQQFPHLKFNNTFQNKQPNLVQAFPKQTGHYFQAIPPFYNAQPYQGRPQIANQNLQKMNPYNQGKYQYLDMLHPQGYIPDALKQKLSKPHIFYNGRLPPANYHNYFMRQSYGPYPYMYNWNPQNSTIHLPQMMPPYVTNQAKIDTQLSDEMKRELRDGKIIVLSDSVVRSNFKPENNENITQSITYKPEPQQMDMKNETLTEN